MNKKREKKKTNFIHTLGQSLEEQEMNLKNIKKNENYCHRQEAFQN